MTPPAELLHHALVQPETMAALQPRDWNALIRAARSEMLLGSLAHAARGIQVPAKVSALFAEASDGAAMNQNAIRFEIERMEEALAGSGIPVLLMKGAAYMLADLPPLPGRQIGDLDVMVPAARLAKAEALLKAHGWQSVKPRGGYDDQYYREWMHELPPLAHERRGNVIDLHHNIMPRTARLSPRPTRMFEHAVPVTSVLSVMGPEDMLLHAAAHLAYDGDFQGGARNLWDIDRLTRHFASLPDFWTRVQAVAHDQQLKAPLARALRLAAELYGTPSPSSLRGRSDIVDLLALRKLRGLDEYGQRRTPISDFLLFVRGHWLRMPPFMLARHLTTKWRARRREARLEGRSTNRSRRPPQAPVG
ncbi:nucleotidyltransferase domain-containing protein [Pacificimonas flava]|uniref:Nucleotidyltransferase family protein n=1 Tax=Pacificimonas flava TaxID=1234595 RepID=M2U8C5_9SPHN|nr:nucleotidyltransferase family protein [Pacificimonas flava]EMD84227.1 hypothetical protein C725_0157 [Pacificimonas flava]MBB5279896.1 hypothetical protein [Pacificimonas flava]